MMMVVLLPLVNACSTKVTDFTFCHEIPGGKLGADCANFLTTTTQILNDAQWQAQKAQWNSQGFAVACTTSNSEGNIKKFIEQACSQINCDYATTQALFSALDRMQASAKRALDSPRNLNLNDAMNTK